MKSDRFDGVKVFSATVFADRQRLGEKVTEWIAANAPLELVDMVITQSSDASFHCIAITVFFRDRTRSTTGGVDDDTGVGVDVA